MKVLMINVVCGSGSTGRICTDIADMLSACGHEVKIAYGRGTVAPEYQKYAHRIGADTDVALHGVRSRLLDDHGLGSAASTKRFVEWIRDFNPDLIHLHNLHGYYVNYEILFSYLRQADKPVVWTLHDCWAFTGHCAHYSAAGCSKWQTHCENCPQKGTYPASLLMDNSSRNFDRKRTAFCGVPNLQIVTPSDWLASQVRKSFLGEYPVERIYNGVDLEVFKPVQSDFRDRYHLTNQKILLGAAGTWSRYKGLDDLIAISGMLSDDYRMVIAGLPEGTRLPANVIAVPRTENMHKLAELYASADVFLNPSREETMGMSTLEALACGTPVITYDQTAVPEVADETCGIAVPCDPAEMYAALDRLHVSAEACIARAAQFEKNQQYRNYLSLYERMMKQE